MRGLGFIIFLVVVAIQIISAIAAKRKQEQERRAATEAAERRRIMMETGISEVVRPDSPPTMASPTRPTGDDVEARRRAQLEQLRQRRESKRQGVTMSPPTVQPPLTRRGVPTPTLSPRPISNPAPTLGGSEQSRIRAMEAERRTREAQRQWKEQQARAAAEADAVETKAERAEYEMRFHRAIGKEQGGSASQTARQSRTSPTSTTETGTARSADIGTSIRVRLRDPASVRELFVLQEILGRPTGLKGE